MENFRLFDGAFGSLISNEYPELESPESANISMPNAVLDIHRRYIAAGATAIKTNTFSLNPLSYDIQTCSSLIDAGWKLATEAALPTGTEIFADIGPITGETAENAYLTVVQKFSDLGATHFLFETQCSTEHFKNAIEFIRSHIKEATVICSFSVGPDGYSRAGLYYTTLFSEALNYGADTVGLNCQCGPAHTLHLLKDVISQKKFPSSKLCAMPNSGYPSVNGNRTVFRDNPAYYAEKMVSLFNLGIRTLGGCCGTTPSHIHAFLTTLNSTGQTLQEDSLSIEFPAPGITALPLKKSFVAAEMSPPANADFTAYLASAKELKSAGADYLTVPDSPLARGRANSCGSAALLTEKAGIQVIPHLCCRDKNRIAIHGDLLSAHMFGVRNVLAVTGDPISRDGKQDNSNVFNFNSFQLIGYIEGLNKTDFQTAPFQISAGLNTSAKKFEVELDRAKRKRDAGCTCFFTQPVFTDTAFENLAKAQSCLDCTVAAGIMLVSGYKNAVFMNNEVPGVSIPNELIDKLQSLSKSEAAPLCVDFGCSLADKVAEITRAFYLITPLNRFDLTVQLIQYIKRRYDK